MGEIFDRNFNARVRRLPPGGIGIVITPVPAGGSMGAFGGLKKCPGVSGVPPGKWFIVGLAPQFGLKLLFPFIP